MKKKTLLFLALAVIVVLLATLTLGRRGVEVQLDAVAPTTMTDTYTEKGIVQSGHTQTILAAVSGPLLEIAVQQNSIVQAGDILARIDPQPLLYEKALHESSLSAANSQLEQARISNIMTTNPSEYLATLKDNLAACQSSYDLARTNADAQNQLYQAGAASKLAQQDAQTELLAAQAALTKAQERYQTSQTALQALEQNQISTTELNRRFQQSTLEQLQAQIDSETASLTELDRQLATCTITANVNGYVTAVPAEGLSQIQAGQTIALLKSNDAKTVTADVLTTVEPYLTVGGPVTLTQTMRGEDRTFSGRIQEIDQFAQAGTSALGLAEYRVRVTIAVDDPDAQLKDGYQLEARFTLYAEDQQLIVPNSALFKEDGQYYLFTVNGGRACKTPVEIGHQSSTEAVIISGLAEGMQIIRSANTEDLADGVRVRAATL